MNSTYTIHREGSERVELVVEAYSVDDALNTFADHLERGDVPAFYYRDGAGVAYISADRERYYARPASS